MQITPLKPADSRSLLKSVSPATAKRSGEAELNELLSYMSGPQDLVQIRPPSIGELRIQSVRTILTSRSTAQVASSLVGAAIGGPLGLAGAAILNGITSFADARENRVASGVTNAIASGVAGAVGLIPGGLGTLAIAGVSLGAAGLVVKGNPPQKFASLKLDEFAPKYLDKVQAHLKFPGDLKKPDWDGLSAQKAEKLAAQAVTCALRVCCEQLSPKVAVALARETAKEMVAPFSIEEFRYERMIAPTPAKHLGENIFVADIPSATPAAASTQKAFLSPKAQDKYSGNALVFMLGHEMSHVENRDMVGNLGGTTLKTALRIEGNTSLNPLDWIKSSSLERKVDLAVAEISRETEYRCDREGAQKLLELGAETPLIEGAAFEIFSPEKGSKSPTAAHPLPQDRIAAIGAFLRSS